MEVALAEQRQTGKRFGSTLVELKFIDENVLAAFLSRQIDIPCISLLHIDIPKKVARKLNRAVALETKSIPVRTDEEGRLEVAMVDPTDEDSLLRLEEASEMQISPLIAPESSVQMMIEKIYPDQPIDEDTLSSRTEHIARNLPSDPTFWDVIAELESGDLDGRLTRIEKNLEQIWVLLEKVLRTLEVESVPRER